MPIAMEALGYQNYNGRWYVRGSIIQVASEADAADMTALRLAKRLPVAPPAKMPAVEDRSMTIETEDSALAAPQAKDNEDEKRAVPPPKRGQYLHRSPRASR